MSVREYAVLYLGAGGKKSSGSTGGGNVAVTAGPHTLDGVEHNAASDSTRLDATDTAHGLLPKLSGSATDTLLGDGTWGVVATGAPTDVDYLVGTASGSLSAEIVVGTTPGGELGGTWASPTVDATHSGSAHLALGSTSSTAAAGDHAHSAYMGELLVADAPLDYPLGTFMTTAHQTVASTTTAYAVAFAAEGDVDGLTHSTVTNNSRIYIQQSGEYSIIVSAIADDTAADKTHMDIWLAINGANVADSNTRVEIATKEVEMVVAAAFGVDLVAGQYIEIMYRGDATTTRLVQTAAGSSPTRPASPAVILTINLEAPMVGFVSKGITLLISDGDADLLYADTA